MILPAETDDALDALRQARERVGDAVDTLNAIPAPTRVLAPLLQAHSAVSWAVEKVAAVIAVESRSARLAREMCDVEERHVDAQVFPWMDEP